MRPSHLRDLAQKISAAARDHIARSQVAEFMNHIDEHINALARIEEFNRMPEKKRLMAGDSAYRKMFPMAEGLLDYFPDALAAVSNLSYLGNRKHNAGEPMHHARSKSTDHADCIVRHLAERGGFDVITVDGMDYRVRHSVALAWRALALAQEEIEQADGLPLPRGARP